MTKSLAILSGRAHAVFQYGHPVAASDQLAPYCEFEVRQLSGDVPRRIAQGTFAVTRVRHRLLRDPTTRLPVMLRGSGCFVPFSRKTVWRCARGALWLRCLMSHDGCSLSPSLTPAQVQREVGPYLRVRVHPSDAGW